MSPLWRDQVRVVLSPQRAAVLRLARSRTPRITRQCVVPCDPAKPGEASWRHTLAALDTALAEFGEHKADTVVILSNHFVRYALVEHSDQVSTDAEEMALVRHSFSTIYGNDADGWALRLNDAGARDGLRIACAVDQDFPEALRTRFNTTKFRLRSIQPYLMAAFNRWCHRFDGSVWFVLGEPGKLCLARFQDGQCQSIKTMRIGDDWSYELAVCLEREKLLQGIDAAAAPAVTETPVFVFAPGYSKSTPEHEKELWP